MTGGALALSALYARQLTAQSIQLTPASPVDSFALATAHGRFWFTARVVRRDTVTTRLIRRTAQTTAVEVETVIATPKSIRLATGRVITTIVGDTTGVVPGARFLFIAAGVAADTSLVLRERGRVPLEAPTDAGLVTPRLFAADTANLLTALRLRVDSAAMIATLRVATIVAPQPGGRGPGVPSPGIRRTDSDPRWRRALVNVVDSLAGEAGVAPIPYSVYFPGSRSWAWARAPRLAQDTVVVVVGRRVTTLPPNLRLGLDTLRAYVVIDSLDVRPVRDSSLVRRVLP